MELRNKVDEYLRPGVPCIWIIDPEAKTGEIYTQDGRGKITAGVFEAGDIRADLSLC